MWRSQHDRKDPDPTWIDLVKGAAVGVLFYVFIVIVFSVQT